MSTSGRTLAEADDRRLLVAGLAVGVGTGLAVGLAPGVWDGVILLTVGVVVAAVVGLLLRGPAEARPVRSRLTGRQVLALAALYLVFASTFTFRQRTATELASDPLDLAGQFRVLSLAGAFVLACVSMLTRRFTLRGLPPSGWLMLGYVAVVPLGLVEAVSKSLVLFKWSELVTFLVVWLAVTLAFRGQADVPLRHYGIALGLLLGAVLAGILHSPSLALKPLAGIIPFQLQGTQPQLSSNDVGTLGMLVVAYGLGRRRVSPGLVALGGAVLLASGYRTGYLGVAAMVVVWLVLRGHAAARVVLIGLAVLLPVVAQAHVVEQVWLRDEASATNLSTLTGRTVWWGEAIDAAERSPLTGIGLASGVRFEVLQARFNGTTSTIHSTWVEAYVGAGLLGVGLLALALLTAIASALRRWRHDGALLPILVLVALSVKSITGSTIEIGGILLLLFLLVVSAAHDRPAVAVAAPPGTDPDRLPVPSR